MFALPTLSEAITAPVVGEIVRLPSELATEVTALLPPTHVPFTAKQPVVKLIPLAKVEDAVVEVRFNIVALIPPPNVEVAAPETLSWVVEANVVTAKVVVVALVVVAFVVTKPPE